MAGNTIQITFGQDIELGSILTINGTYNNGESITPLEPQWFWVNLRNASYRVTTGSPTGTVGERAAINFVAAFTLDYNGSGLHQVSRVGNVVNIVSPLQYSWQSGTATRRNGDNTELLLVFFKFENSESNLPFNITNVEFLQYPADKCGKVNVKVTTNVNISEVLEPVSVTGVNDTTYTFAYNRAAAGNISLKSSQTPPLNAVQGFQTPSLLSPDNQIVTINQSPNGATVILTSENQYGLTLQYALVAPNQTPLDEDYQDLNIYSGIDEGEYWIYFKDQFGCVKYKEFSVDQLGNSRAPYFYISKSNSIRFANRITFGDAANYKNDENTLSCEVDVLLPYMEVQQFQTADVITNQFKSNYAVNTATVIEQDGNEVTVPVIQKTSYLNSTDKRDAIMVNLGEGKTGIYFQSGNTYDYDTGVVNGTYSLNGALPYWAVFGAYFSIGSTWYQIEEIYFDETYNADIILFTNTYEGLPQNIVIGAVYDTFNFEIYEFAIDMVNYIDQEIRVRIDCTDDNFGNLQLLSEKISVKVRHSGTLDITYKNYANNDVYYATGIQHRIRQLFTLQAGMFDGQSENKQTDTNTSLSSVDLYEADEFTFEPVTKELMRKIVMALSHEYVTIDGVQYVINGLPEIDGPLEKSNLYVVKAKMVKTGNAYNNDNGNYGFNDSNSEIPALIEYEAGFIKY